MKTLLAVFILLTSTSIFSAGVVQSMERNKDSLSAIAQNHPEPLKRAHANYQLAYYSLSSPATALPFALKASEGYAQCNEIIWQAHSYRMQKRIYAAQNDLKNAYHAIFMAKHLYEKEHNTENIIYCLLDIATLYRDAGDFQSSEDWLLKALDQSHEIGGSTKALVHYNLGKLHFQAGNGKASLENYSIAASSFEGSAKYANTLLGMGDAHRKLIQYDSALQYYTQALLILDKLPNNKQQRAYTFFNIGSLYYDQANYERAQAYFQQSLNTYTEKGNAYLEAINALARTHMALSKFKEALSLANEGIALGSQHQLGKPLLGAYEIAVDALHQLGKHEAAVLTAKESRPYYHNVQWEEKQEILADYKQQIKEGELLVYQELMLHKTQTARSRWLWGFASILATLLISLMAGLYYRRRFRKANLELQFVAQETYRIFADMTRMKQEIEDKDSID